MFIFQNKNILKDESLQKYINISIQKSIYNKINKINKINNKKNTYYLKSPVKCDLHYLNCDYKWSNKDLLNDCNYLKHYLNNKCMDTKEYLKNDLFVPFYFYFISTNSFFLWNYFFQGNL